MRLLSKVVFVVAAVVLVTSTNAVAQLAGEIREGRIIVVAEQSTPVRGVDFISSSGLLVPTEPTATPFQFLLSNTPQQVTWGNLGTNIVLDGEWATGVGYRGTASDLANLRSAWGSIESQAPSPLPMSFVSGGPWPNEPILTPNPQGAITIPTNPVNPPVTPRDPPPSVSNENFRVSVNASNQLVIHASGYELNSLAVTSDANALLPAENAAPFASLEANGTRQIGYFSPRPLILDGGITLSAGVDASIGPIEIRSGGNELLFSGIPDPCGDDCPAPMLGVSFDDEQRFVLHGSGQTLTELDFYSHGSLVPANDASPFESLSSNSRKYVGYRSPEGLSIDGTLTLSSGWDANGVVGDVAYGYTDADGNRTSGLAIPTDFYLDDRHLDAVVTDSNRIRLTGTGHRVNSVQFSSRSGSLVPTASASPFDSIGENSSNVVQLFQSDGNVTLDGEIVLGVGWDPKGQQDVRFEYDGVGNWPNGGYYLSRGSYPTSDGSPRPNVWLSLDEDYRVILNADGKQLLGVEFLSAKANLVPGGSPDPFSFYLANSAHRTTLGAFDPVEVEGSVRTESRFNPFLKSKDLSAAYGPLPFPGFNAAEIGIQVLPTDLAICPGCAVPEVAFTEEGQMFIEGFEDPLSRIEITSASGALVPLIIDADDFLATLATSSEIHLSGADGVDAFVRQLLPVGWDPEVGAGDLLVQFTTLGGTDIGPFELAESTYDSVTAGADLPRLDIPVVPEATIPEPSSCGLFVLAVTGLLGLRTRREY